MKMPGGATARPFTLDVRFTTSVLPSHVKSPALRDSDRTRGPHSDAVVIVKMSRAGKARVTVSAGPPPCVPTSSSIRSDQPPGTV